MKKHWLIGLVLGCFTLGIVDSWSQEIKPLPDPEPAQTQSEVWQATIDNGLTYLVKSQSQKGSWGTHFKVAVTGMGGLAFLAQAEEPFDTQYTDALLKAYQYLMAIQRDGIFPKQKHSWIHGQGFATLFLAEFYGKLLICKKIPKIEPGQEELKAVVARAVKVIEGCQSATGGWWYDQTRPGGSEHEGSTTVCAVQALRAAANYGITIDKSVLEKGFEYLKKDQNPDGGFRYKLEHRPSKPGVSAAALSTLVLMRKLDYPVLFSGMKYMKTLKPQGIINDGFPHYATFYAAMAMKGINDEYGKEVPEAAKWLPAIFDELVKRQGADGSWPKRGWISGNENTNDYPAALSVLALQTAKGHLSVFHRIPPKLP